MTDISIIVPIYNASKYLKKCIDSLVGQTKKELEFILINDGSTDDSEDIIKSYQDKRIKYYKNQNQGIGKTRNFGIEKATGKYILFIDSDDYMKENATELLFKKAEENHLDVVICDYYKVENDQAKEEKIISFQPTTLKKSPNLIYDVNLSPWNKLYKTSLLKKEKIRFVENLKYEDAPFVLECLDKASKIGKVDSCLNYYVIHENSETTVRDDRVFDILKIVDKIRKYFSKKKYAKEFIDKITVRIITSYTIQQRMQQDEKIGRKFIKEGFAYLKKEVPNYKDNKYYQSRGIARRTIEKSKPLTQLYYNFYRLKKDKIACLVSIFYLLFALLFTYTLGNSLLNNHNVILQVKPWLVIITSVIYLFFGYLLYRFIQYKPKKNKIGIILLLILFFLLQLGFAYVFVVDALPSGWDFGAVHGAAVADVLGGTKITDEWYLYRYGNNIGIALLLKSVYSIAHLLGIEHYIFIGIIVNIIMIDLAILFLYKVTKLCFSKSKVTLFLVLSLLFTPFITYVPIFYTDTISLPFGIAAIYFVLKSLMSKKYSWLVIAGLLLGIGSCLKFTVLIILIGIILFYFLKEDPLPWKENIKQLIILILAALLPLAGLSTFQKLSMDQKEVEKESFPLIHWIMMGTVEEGGYNHSDVVYTGKFKSKEEKSEQALKRLKLRMNNHIKNKDLISFYTKKIVYTWGDGTFFAPEKLQRTPKKDLPIKSYIIHDQTNKNVLYQAIAQAQLILLLSFIIIGTVLRKYLTKSQRNIQLLLNISIIGIFLFLLIWEARSRYIVNYIPLLLLSSYLGIESVIAWRKTSYDCKIKESKL